MYSNVSPLYLLQVDHIAYYAQGKPYELLSSRKEISDPDL